MPVGLIAINVVFAVFVFAAISGALIWAIRTAGRDHHIARRPAAVPDPRQGFVAQQPVEFEEPLVGVLVGA